MPINARLIRPLPIATPDQIRRAADFCEESFYPRKVLAWIAEQPAAEKSDYLSAGVLSRTLAVGRKDVIEFFKRLEKIRVSHWTVGRHSNPSRMYWRCQSKSFGTAVLAELERREDDTEPTPDDAVPGDLVEHSFKLRPESTLQFRLPRNFSMKDAERIGAWLKTLPFE